MGKNHQKLPLTKKWENYPFLKEKTQVTKQKWDSKVPPLVTIYCKAYMHENYIRDAIEGFLMQKTTFKVEIWIHDDASTDSTARIIKDYESKHPQLFVATYQVENQYKKRPKTDKYVKPPKRQGKYIAPCEGDDFWTDPLKLQKQVEFLEANPDYVMCYHRHRKQRGSVVDKISRPRNAKSFTGIELAGTPSGIATATKLFRNVYLNTRVKRPRRLSDYMLNAYISNFGGCKFMPDISYSVHRLHDGGVWTSKADNDKSFSAIKIKYDAYTYFKELNDQKRIRVCLLSLRDTVDEKLFDLLPGHKTFVINRNQLSISFFRISLKLVYGPFIVYCKTQIKRLIGYRD